MPEKFIYAIALSKKNVYCAQSLERDIFSSTEIEFVDVIGTKVFPLIFTVTSTNGFYLPPPPLSKSG